MKKTTQPEWLGKWLNLQFYAKECEKHRLKYHTVYCGSCNNGRPACEVCWETISDQHDDETHQILKVRIASRRASTDVKEIRKFLDVSKIQIYKINKKNIVFLNSKPEAEAAPNGGGAQSIPNCRTCGISLKKDDKGFRFEFCSIACKYYPREEVDDLATENKSDDDDEEKSKHNINYNLLKRNNDECCKVPTSRRKKSRKHENPTVAPLM